ncbi:TIGR04222 domain-containing membrane protein [Streptomyces sp. NPDC002734]|uniref:TIGR04222 domain-containing membrane protein n=1 Tax=Streptomyces sp. NPDC002734 TaxID=3154426 RepID=UPI00332A703A
MGERGEGDGGRPLDAYRIAVLRGGDRAAVTVAVVALHGRGLVEAAEPGFLKNTGPLSGRAAHPLEKAVHAALYRPLTLLELTERARVRMCVRTLRSALAAEGLLHRRTYTSTRAGRRLLRALGAAAEPPAHATGPPEERDALRAVALRGDAALLTLVPHLARDARLTGPPVRREALLPDAPDGPGPLTTRMYRELHDRDGEERGGDGRDGDGHGTGGGGGGHDTGGHHACGSGSGCGGGW